MGVWGSRAEGEVRRTEGGATSCEGGSDQDVEILECGARDRADDIIAMS